MENNSIVYNKSYGFEFAATVDGNVAQNRLPEYLSATRCKKKHVYSMSAVPKKYQV